MGRLDDAAKRKVVELREAGLSFRKIKAVLELENIKVSAQAIYLFLKEFQGRARREDGAAGRTGHAVPTSVREVGSSETRQVGWSDQQLRNLLREASRVAASQQATSSSAGQSSGTASRGEAQEREKDEDIRIVSVTSLAQGTQHAGVQVPRSGGGTGAMSAANFARRRHTPSPANPVLVARRRLLDKALLHRARVREGGPQTGQQVPLSVRRDQSCFTGPDGRKVGLPQTASYDLTRAPNMRGSHQGPFPPKRWMQRTGTPVRTLQHPPRIAVRPPDPAAAGNTSQNAGPPARVQNVTSQSSPPPQRNILDPGAVSGLQEQIQSLSSELRNLGVALRMMAEQQGRLEREQAQQTQVQKQILSTLQEVATRLEPCNVLQSPSSSTLPASCSLASSEPFSQAAPNQGIYAQCSQAQTRYNEIHDSGLEGIEGFSLDQLSPATMNGFQQCPNTGVPSFTHSQTFSHSPYTQSHTDSYTGMNNKSVDMPSTSSNGTFQSCSPPNQPSSLPVSPHETELNIIKVENV
ncbi:uncharacterized protein [Misgurnus anguillicaudatus]|uniref:uncharacterized protein n=1 Tax=Misgurnus anguillicaudatus TaxID=75329 RepID=UPI003CCF97F4